MDIFAAYSWMRTQYVRWVGTNTPFDANKLQAVILRELRYRRKYPASVSPGLLLEIRDEFRTASAILRAYPAINDYHTRLLGVR